MKHKSLQIKLLSKSGELLSCITCYAGQVSVFRAYSAAELKPYQRALAGIPGPERFSITLDDAPFVPEEHIFIGFGERFAPGAADLTVNDFLLNSGVPQNAIFSTLVSYSLENFASAKCSSLPSCEERRLRLLAATYSTGKVLILNDPFEPISGHWRERFAELLVNYARTKEEIVVVTSLTYRPDIWIDNEYIDRIQVGENIQKTIGFGSSRSSMNALIDQVRATVKQEKLAGGPGAPLSKQFSAVKHPLRPGETSSQKLETKPLQPESSEFFSGPASKTTSPGLKPAELQTKRSPERAQPWAVTLFALIGFLAVCLGVLFGQRLFYPSSKPGEPEKVASLGLTPSGAGFQTPSQPDEASSSQALNVTSLSQALTSQIPEATESPPAAASPVQMAANMFVLDYYPPEIRRAVLESFEGNLSGQSQPRPATELKAPRVSTEEAQKSGGAPPRQPSRSESSKTAVDLLNVLQSTSGTGEALPDQIRPPANQSTNLSPEEMAKLSPEQRREVIRQKFLEAIQRAAQQKP